MSKTTSGRTLKKPTPVVISSVPLVVKYEDIHGSNASPKRPDIRFEDEIGEKKENEAPPGKLEEGEDHSVASEPISPGNVERPRVNSSNVLLINKKGETLTRQSMIDEFKSFSTNLEKKRVPPSPVVVVSNVEGAALPPPLLLEAEGKTARKGGGSTVPPPITTAPTASVAKVSGDVYSVTSGMAGAKISGGGIDGRANHNGHKGKGGNNRGGGYSKGGYDRTPPYHLNSQQQAVYSYAGGGAPPPPLYQGSPPHFNGVPMMYTLSPAGPPPPPPHYSPMGGGGGPHNRGSPNHPMALPVGAKSILAHGHVSPSRGPYMMSPRGGFDHPSQGGSSPRINVGSNPAVAAFTAEMIAKFAASHLENDFYLRCCMNSAGWITINALMHFSWVQAVTSDIQVVSHGLGLLLHMFELSLPQNQIYQYIMINDQVSNLSLLKMKFRLKHDTWRWVLEEGQRQTLRQQMFPNSYHPYYG